MARIQGISYYLPEKVLSNDQIKDRFPEWSVDKIANKTGIRNRHIAAVDEFSSTMAVKAAQRLFEDFHIDPATVEYVLLCTQSPDYFLPTTACLVQDQLGIPITAGALDFNLGCSGYIYGLSLAKGLILSGDVKNVLFITTETYSKYLEETDKSVRTIFGDAAAATFITKETGSGTIGSFVFGTDGSGAANLIVENGATRHPIETNTGFQPRLYMNGPEIFTFTLQRVPDMVKAVLTKHQLPVSAIDLFVFHQANRYMLEHLQAKMDLPAEKCFLYLADCGNTVSSTIPIALKEAMLQGRVQKGMKVLLAGFGVGYSWGATVLSF